MGNENHNHHHHHQYQSQYQKSTFLPMLCSRPSLKDVSIPRGKEHSLSSGNDPLSPRISCMGQVKRNNKIGTSHRLSFSSTRTTASTTPCSPSVKYSKLKKLFSGKSFNVSTPATTTATISSCRTRQRVATTIEVSKTQRSVRNENCNNVVSINIENMDPPLPVTKKREPKMEDSLWKRRSGTGRPALKSLQLQQIHHPRICHREPPTV